MAGGARQGGGRRARARGAEPAARNPEAETVTAAQFSGVSLGNATATDYWEVTRQLY